MDDEENKPKCVYNGVYKEWKLNGQRHRTDGPAIEWWDGDKEWWINHQEYSFEDYILKLQELGLQDDIVKLLFELDSY